MKPKISCPNCNGELRWGDKFCGNCGKRIEWSDVEGAQSDRDRLAPDDTERDQLTCATCGTVNKPGTDHCRTCGSDLRDPSKAFADTAHGKVKEAKRDQVPTKKELRPLPLLSTWKLAVVFAVIVAGAVATDVYVSKENIPEQPVQQEPVQPQSTGQQMDVPQPPAAANMAALPQIEDMEKQVRANPDDAGLTLQLANFLSDNRFYDKAITYYQAYLRRKPKDTNARVDMGICYKEIGQYDEATREMKKALEYDPTHLYATFNLGVVALDEGKMYMDQGKMDKANAMVEESNDWFRKAVALAPTSDVGKRAQQLLSQHSNTQLPPSN